MFSKNYKLQQINNEIYDTKIGSLPPTGSWPQPGWFGKNARVAFIGQNPGLPRSDEPFEHERRQDCYIKYVFESPTGKIIQDIISESGLTLDDVAYTNVVKSPTPSNRQAYDYEIAYYKEYLKKQLECTDITTFVIFGKQAVNSLLGEVEIPGQALGANIDWTNKAHKVFAAYHPAYVLRIGKVVEYKTQLINFIKEENAKNIFWS